MKKLVPLLVLLIILAGCGRGVTNEKRDYKNSDPKICETMSFGCPEGQQPFSDRSGCGCEVVD